MDPLRLFVGGKPIPQGRPRVQKNGHVYYKTDKTGWREKVTWALLAKRPAGWDSTVAFAVELEFIFAPPKKSERLWPMGDCDNLAKLILDAAQDAGIVADDSSVVSLLVEKRFAEPDDDEGAEIRFTPRLDCRLR